MTPDSFSISINIFARENGGGWVSYSFFRHRAVIGGQLFSCHHQKIVLTGQNTALLRIYRNHKSTGNQIMAQKILPDKLRCQKNCQKFVVVGTENIARKIALPEICCCWHRKYCQKNCVARSRKWSRNNLYWPRYHLKWSHVAAAHIQRAQIHKYKHISGIKGSFGDDQYFANFHFCSLKTSVVIETVSFLELV